MKSFVYPDNDIKIVSMTITATKLFLSSEGKENQDDKGGLF